MKNSSIFRNLILLNLLMKNKYSRKQLVEEYQKMSIDVKETTILNYINKLKKHDIKIQEETINKTIYYYIKNINLGIILNRDNIRLLYDVKQLLFAQKKYQYIKYMMELFYLVSMHIKDTKIKEDFLDFGYFSRINCGLVELLEKHCKTKDILILDYLLPYGGNKFIQFHVDKIMMSSMSQRLYLYGMLENGYDFFQLPIDRIFMVKKVLRTNVRFNFKSTLVTYKVSKNAFLETGLDENEVILNEDEDYVTLQTPVTNEFYLVQRLLNYCPDLYYITEGRIKNLVKEKLEILKANYDEKSIDR